MAKSTASVPVATCFTSPDKINGYRHTTSIAMPNNVISARYFPRMIFVIDTGDVYSS